MKTRSDYDSCDAGVFIQLLSVKI